MNRSYIRLSFSRVLAFLFLGFFVFVSLRFLFFLFLFFFFFLFFLFLLFFFFFFFFFFPPYPVLMPFLRRLLPIIEKNNRIFYQEHILVATSTAEVQVLWCMH